MKVNEKSIFLLLEKDEHELLYNLSALSASNLSCVIVKYLNWHKIKNDIVFLLNEKLNKLNKLKEEQGEKQF